MATTPGQAPVRCNSAVISRISPIGFRNGCISTDSELNEIQLHNETNETNKCYVDHCCEYISSTSEKHAFSDQDSVWQRLVPWLNKRKEQRIIRSSVLVVGCPGSGKSYTLYGGNNAKERGLVPRFLEHVFNVERAACVVVQMSHEENELLTDLLDPPAVYSAHLCLASTTSLGVVNMRGRRVVSRSAANAREIVGTGLQCS